MSISLIDLLNREKALIEQLDAIDESIEEFEKKLSSCREKKHSTEMKLASIRSMLTDYVEKNLIKYPNNDPHKNPEA